MDKEKIMQEINQHVNNIKENTKKYDKVKFKYAIFDMSSHVEAGLFIGYTLYLIFFDKLATTNWGIPVLFMASILFCATFTPIFIHRKHLKRELKTLNDELNETSAILKEMMKTKGINQREIK